MAVKIKAAGKTFTPADYSVNRSYNGDSGTFSMNFVPEIKVHDKIALYDDSGVVISEGVVMSTTFHKGGAADFTFESAPPAGSTWWATSTGGEWMAHPMTGEEIIDDFARRLAKVRPAD